MPIQDITFRGSSRVDDPQKCIWHRERMCCKNEKIFEVSLINILRAPRDPLKRISSLRNLQNRTHKFSSALSIFHFYYSILVSSLLPLSQTQGSTGSFVFKMPWDSHISLRCPLYTPTPKLLRNCQFSVKTNSVAYVGNFWGPRGDISKFTIYVHRLNLLFIRSTNWRSNVLLIIK